jgi:hypothetical protein
VTIALVVSIVTIVMIVMIVTIVTIVMNVTIVTMATMATNKPNKQHTLGNELGLRNDKVLTLLYIYVSARKNRLHLCNRFDRHLFAKEDFASFYKTGAPI